MNKQDWVLAGVVAILVAGMTVTLIAPPRCWAVEKGTISVPSLPSSGVLVIPSLNATVTAEATPAAGKPVEVQLSLTSPARLSADSVPVTITVLSASMSSIMARSGPLWLPVTHVDTTLPIGTDGKGKIVVPLPLLVWTSIEASKTSSYAIKQSASDNMKVNQFTNIDNHISYRMQISSPLGAQPSANSLTAVNIKSISMSASNSSPQKESALIK